MSNRTTLKNYFVTNAVPKQSDFSDLIDSGLNQNDDSIRKQGNDPISLQAQPAVNDVREVLHFYKNFADPNAAWKINLVDQSAVNPTGGLNINNPVSSGNIFIKDDGSLGIHTNSPYAALDVKGNIYTTIHGGDNLHDANNRGVARIGMQSGNATDGFAGMELQTEAFQTGNGGIVKFLTWGNNIAETREVMRINEYGNVGIGTSNPRSKLDVGLLSKGQLGSVFARLSEGDYNGEGTFLGVRGYVTQIDDTNPAGNVKSFSIEHSFYGQINSSVNFFRGGSTQGGFLSFSTNNNTERLRIDASGNVGIGTATPTAKLEVSGSVPTSIASYGYLNSAGSVGKSSGGFYLSIKASDRIIATEFDAYSDQRIKKDFLSLNSQQSLETISQVQVKSFIYKDEVQHGSELHTGVIAQELEEVFPQSVSVHSDFVPDIYSLPASALIDNAVLSITMPAPHNVQTGDTVRFFTASGAKENIVTKIDDTSFSVDNWQEEAAGIFVYGKKVNDYCMVNYNSIFCLGISAIQELHKQLQQLKGEVIILKEKLAAAFVPAL